jgi:hypothetical protein
MRRGTGILALVLALAVPAAAHAVSWRTYANERFGTTADVPSDWQPGEAPANGEMCKVLLSGRNDRTAPPELRVGESALPAR